MAAESGNANALAYLGKVSKVIRNMLCFAWLGSHLIKSNFMDIIYSFKLQRRGGVKSFAYAWLVDFGYGV